MKPKYIHSFAGSYILGENLHYKNKYLTTATWDECGSWLRQNNIESTQAVLLREQDTFAIQKGISDKEYQPIDVDQMKKYIEQDLFKIKYPLPT